MNPGDPVYLTFDDGPDAEQSHAILDILARFDAKAAFFVVGSRLDAAPQVVDRLLVEGHAIGNHTWSHERLAGMQHDEFLREVGKTQKRLVEMTGKRPLLLRPPFGSMDRNTRRWAGEEGLEISLWDVDPMDWDRPGVGYIQRTVVEEACPRSVVLLHDGGGDREQTITALPSILTELSDKGAVFPALPAAMSGQPEP